MKHHSIPQGLNNTKSTNLMILQEAALHLHPALAGDLHVLRLNVVLHLRLWDGVAAVGAHFNVSSTVDFMDDEIDCRNVLFAGRKSLRLLSRNSPTTNPSSCSQQKDNVKKDFNEFMV